YDGVNYNLATGPITVNLAAGTVTGDNSVGVDTLRGIESVRGSDFADTFNAVGYTASYAASPSTNSDDAFIGGTFNSFEGMGGNDAITGNGNTRIEYSNALEPVTVTFTSGGSGTVVGGPSVGTDTFTGVNQAWGSPFGDTFTGSSSNETFGGRGGNDTIDGG